MFAMTAELAERGDTAPSHTIHIVRLLAPGHRRGGLHGHWTRALRHPYGSYYFVFHSMLSRLSSPGPLIIYVVFWPILTHYPASRRSFRSNYPRIFDPC